MEHTCILSHLLKTRFQALLSNTHTAVSLILSHIATAIPWQLGSSQLKIQVCSVKLWGVNLDWGLDLYATSCDGKVYFH